MCEELTVVTTAHYVVPADRSRSSHALVEASSLSLKFPENMEDCDVDLCVIVGDSSVLHQDFSILILQQVHYGLVQSHCPSLTLIAHGPQVVRPRQQSTHGDNTPGKASDSLDGRSGSTYGIRRFTA